MSPLLSRVWYSSGETDQTKATNKTQTQGNMTKYDDEVSGKDPWKKWHLS